MGCPSPSLLPATLHSPSITGACTPRVIIISFARNTAMTAKSSMLCQSSIRIGLSWFVTSVTTTNHERPLMPSTNFLHPVERTMTVEAASNYAARLLEQEQRGSDVDAALYRLEARYGLSPNQVLHLRSGRAKTCDVGLFARLRSAYLDLCERQVTKLQHEIAITKATSDDDDLENLEAEAVALAEKIRAKKAGQRLARGSAADDQPNLSKGE